MTVIKVGTNITNYIFLETYYLDFVHQKYIN